MKTSIYGIIQRALDAIVILVSFAIAYRFYFSFEHRRVAYDLTQFLLLGGFTSILFILVFQSVRLYERQVSLLNVVESRRLLIGWGLGSLFLFTATFYFRFLDLSRIMMSVALGISFPLLIIERSLVYRLHILAWLRASGARPTVIYGAGVVGKHLFKRIYHSPAFGINIVGFLDDDESLWGKEVQISEIRKKIGTTVFGGIEKLESLKAQKDLKEVFIALPNATYQRNLEIVNHCRKLGINVSVVPPTYGHQMHNLEVQDIGGIPVLKEKTSEPHFLYPFIKRSFDIITSCLMMVFLSPIFIVLAFIVKYDSPGPILFRQRRVGLSGREFDFFKFRSMYSTANPYENTPQSAADPRITRFGRWLRRSSLDELPQLWNVLRGDMSLVGPRPEMPFIVSTYNEEQRERLRVKPGITGVWQISAVRGEPIHANIEYDLFYIEHRSVLLDLIIVIKTIETAIRGIGAY